MVVRRIARWSIIVTTMLFAVSAAVAQTGNPAPGPGGGGKLRAACGQDAWRFCVGVQPGGGRIVQCLSSHNRELSVECGNMIATIQARRSTPDPNAQSPSALPAAPVTIDNPPATIGSILRASCGPDVQRLCAGARRESDVLKCLEFSAHETIDNLQLVFPELGRAADRAKEYSEQKAAVAATNDAPVQASGQ